MIRMIAAVEEKSRGISYRGALPWNIIPEDMQYFRSKTINETIVMGSETFRSLGSIPLPKRKNIVLSKQKTVLAENIVQVSDPTKLLDEDIWVIGGSIIYSMFLPYATELYITEIRSNEQLRFDKFFPSINLSNWRKSFMKPWFVSTTPGISYRFTKYIRIK